MCIRDSYCITAACTSLLHLLCHYMAFHYFPSSVTETLKVAGGFLLGLPHTTTYAGQQFFSTGPMWYLLSLLIGWVLLDAILNIFPEKYTHWAVLGIMLLGWGTTLVWELPFSLSQGAVIVPYLYTVSYTHLRAHETDSYLVCRLLLEKKNKEKKEKKKKS